MQDRFVKIMLVVVAALLAGNLVQSMLSDAATPVPLFLSSAQAQTQTRNGVPAAQRYELKTLTGFPVKDLKSIVPVGDGRSFVASNTEGFMVYQVVPLPVSR